MKIVFTGGGTAGHVFPLYAVAERIYDICQKSGIIYPQMYLFSDKIYDEKAFYNNKFIFVQTTSGNLSSISKVFKLVKGIFITFFKLASVYPDVIMSKGGYVAFPVVFSARILGIPVILHDSDTVPGKVNLWTGKFAQRVAVTYPDITKYYNVEKTFISGQPIRKKLLEPVVVSKDYFGFTEDLPVLSIIGGSSGAMRINQAILDILPKLVEKYNVIHQVGEINFTEVKNQVDFIMKDNLNISRYKMYNFITEDEIPKVAKVSNLFITRAGSMLFEISAWGVPSIVIPLSSSAGDHQRKNAFAYSSLGCAHVIDELNLTPNILLSEIDLLLNDLTLREQMIQNMKKVSQNDAALQIAQEVVSIGFTHGK